MERPGESGSADGRTGAPSAIGSAAAMTAVTAAAVALSAALVLSVRAEPPARPAPAPPVAKGEAKAGKDRPSPAALRERLAEALGLTESQRQALARANEQLDAERAALMSGMEGILAEIKRTLVDESSTPEQRMAAQDRLDDLHEAFRKVEMERRRRLEDLLGPEQKRRLEELSHPPGDAGPGGGGPGALLNLVNRTIRRMGLTAEQSAQLRPHREALERKVHEADRARQAALDEFCAAASAIPGIGDAHRAELEALRTRWNERVRVKGPGKEGKDAKDKADTKPAGDPAVAPVPAKP
jgi:Spy/CpxP family protein refolding chaperone